MNKKTLAIDSPESQVWRTVPRKDMATVCIYGLSLLSAGLFLW